MKPINAFAVVNWRGEIVPWDRTATESVLVVTTDEQHAISSCNHNDGERVVPCTITVNLVVPQ